MAGAGTAGLSLRTHVRHSGAVPVQPMTDLMAAFLVERDLATLTTFTLMGLPTWLPVGFSYDVANGVVRVITFASSVEALAMRHAAAGAAVSQVEGRRWATLEGDVRVVTDSAGVAATVTSCCSPLANRRARADRVAIEISVDRVFGSFLKSSSCRSLVEIIHI